jgi:hypothetical protein
MYILYQPDTLSSSFLVQILYGMGGFVWSFILESGVLQEENIIITNDIVMLQDSQRYNL